jgi:hypothetical protein
MWSFLLVGLRSDSVVALAVLADVAIEDAGAFEASEVAVASFAWPVSAALEVVKVLVVSS